MVRVDLSTYRTLQIFKLCLAEAIILLINSPPIYLFDICRTSGFVRNNVNLF